MSTYSLESFRITGIGSDFGAPFFPEAFFATVADVVGLRDAVTGFAAVGRPADDFTGSAGFTVAFGLATGTTLARGAATFGEDFAGAFATVFGAGLAVGLEVPAGFAIAEDFRPGSAFDRDSAALPSWTRPKAPPANSRIINSPVFTGSD